jgi:hypothetical protein
VSRARFSLGQMLVTPAVLEVASRDEIATCLGRHQRGDWGDCDPDDARSNDRALKTGERIFSVYRVGEGVKIWVITEAEHEGRRLSSCVLLPSDY